MKKMKKLQKRTEEWKKISGDLPDIISFKQAGQEVVGKLVMIKEITDPFENSLYTIEQEDGQLVSVWGSSNLNPKMSKIKKGQLVRIVFTGLKKLEGRGQPMKCFDVYVK